ncbi:MAG: methyltransferase [Candidatus Methanoperedens sp.]
MNASDELDIEKASEDARKLVVLGSALKAGIFQALGKEKDIAALTRELHADKRALYIMLEALCAIGYVDKRKDRYVIADKARPLFLERGEEYVGGYLPHLMNILKAWLLLPQIIKGEKPEKEKRDIAAFMHAMASKTDEGVDETIGNCLKRKKDAKNVLDLGGGPGSYARAFVEKGITAVLYDMPEIIKYVSSEFKLKDVRNLTLKKGDFTKAKFVKEFKNESFDIVFMANIFHIYSEDENSKLLKRVKKLVKNGGMVAIEDFVRGRSPMAEMFAVNMLANTDGGNTYTEEEYRKWLEEAGFVRIEVIDLGEKERQLITAFKE